MYNKKLLVVLFFCIFVSVPAAFGQKIQVVTEELAPYNYTEDGKVVGFCTEVVQEVLKRANMEYSIQSHAWEKSYKLAQTEPDVLIYSIGRSAERESLFKWVGVITRLEVYFFRLKSREDIRINTLDDAKKYKIGAVRDDFRAQLLTKEGFTDQLDFASGDRENIVKLFERKIDIAPVDELTAFHTAGQEGHSFINEMERALYIKEMSVDLHLAFSQQTSDEIVKKCADALASMKKDGTYEKIKSRYDVFYLPIFRLRSF